MRDVGRAAGNVDEAAIDGVAGGIEAGGRLDGGDDELASAWADAESRGEDDRRGVRGGQRYGAE